MKPSLHERSLIRIRLKSPSVPAMLAYFPGPHSYTGDDLVELQVPGNPALLDRLLHQAMAGGARLAQPGEFTFRAFTAGRMDLTQAEGVAATIAAVSDGQLRAAAMLRDGKLGSWSVDLVESLGTQLALVEAGIDFTDQEDVTPIASGELDERLELIEQRLSTLRRRSRSWGALEALPRVVLAGPPSSGKSTLFNALLGRRRAVVSAMPGTTRDVLAEPLALVDARGRRVEAMLVDLAGLDAVGFGEDGKSDPQLIGHPPSALRHPPSIDRQAQAAARRAVEQADLVLRTIGPSMKGVSLAACPPVQNTQERSHWRASRQWHPCACINVYTMSDLAKPQAAEVGGVSVSAVTGEGLDALREAIVHHLGEKAVSVTSEMLALQPRHEAALRTAEDALRQARELLAPQREAHTLANAELVAGCLRATLDELAGLGGQLTPDDVLGRVFATFCVGK